MARLNEPPMSSDSLETLRRKMLRQNRDLAKSNNVRALRIRELEGECALMLSENLELRSRILELEKQVEDNEARRIADHAMAIKAKLESQLTEWGTLLAGLGLEPPLKRHSPRIRKSIKQRMSFSINKPSPSQRRLREVARDIEELGHISENRSYSRQSMNPEQIRALRFEADSEQHPQPEIPASLRYVHKDPVKNDSPPRAAPTRTEAATSPRRMIEPPVLLESPRTKKLLESSVASPEKSKEPIARPQSRMPAQPHTPAPTQASASNKIGSKRKFASEDSENTHHRELPNENLSSKVTADKISIREKAGGRTLKELTHLRKEARDKHGNGGYGRKPLSAKSTNDDVSSPKKNQTSTVTDEVGAAKAKLVKARSQTERNKPKTKNISATNVVSVQITEAKVAETTPITCEVAAPLSEQTFLSANSPEPVSASDEPRGDTPPPTDISSSGETSRPSRRNRATVSYAEPNLRDKMRRPTKDLFDAVTGEGKYARRSSQCDQSSSEGPRIKRESDAEDSLRGIPMVKTQSAAPEPGSIPASPLAQKCCSQDLPTTVLPDRRRRTLTAKAKEAEVADSSMEASESGDVDIYEFTSSSPQVDNDDVAETKTNQRQGATTRRRSAAVESEKVVMTKERSGSRRRSMMV